MTLRDYNSYMITLCINKQQELVGGLMHTFCVLHNFLVNGKLILACLVLVYTNIILIRSPSLLQRQRSH